MKAFMSWSGDRSRQIAAFLQNILKQIFGDVQFYLSCDMSGGIRWSQDIFKAVEESELGFIVFTAENKFEPWLMFEAGCLVKHAGSLVIPIYVNCEMITHGPLREFQGVKLNTTGGLRDESSFRQNRGALLKLIETVARRMPVSSREHSMQLRYLVDDHWWKRANHELHSANILKGHTTGNSMSSEPAEETPVLVYPKYESDITFDAMTQAVRETDTTIGLSSIGLKVYWIHDEFRHAVEHRVLTDARIELKVILKDPASASFSKQYIQTLQGEYSETDSFMPGESLPSTYIEDEQYQLTLDDVDKYISQDRTLGLFVDLFRRVEENGKGKMEIRLYKDFFPHSVLDFGHELYVFLYGINVEATRAPLFRFLPHQAAFKYFKRQFASIESKSYVLASNFG